MRGQSALLLWNDYLGSDEQAFHKWYNRRHIPERVPGLPGFLRARRFAALSGGPKYIAIYDLQTAAALQSQPYRARLDNLDAETRHFVSQFGNTSKTILSAVASAGQGDGDFLAAIGFDADASLLSASDEHIGRLAQRDGIVAAHLLRLDAAAVAAAKPTRPDDQTLPFVLLIEGMSEQSVAYLQTDDCLGVPHGTVRPLRQGIFRLIFATPI
jgi:hypothetical protein